MTKSILTSIRKMLGDEETYKYFDADIIMHINTYLAILTQIGVGPPEGFSITGESETWSDFLGNDHKKLNGVMTYIYIRVRLVFDPPASQAVIDSMKRVADEMEWRLNVTVDTSESES